MGSFDDEGNYTPREIVADDLGMSFADAIDGTMVEVEDGQLVNGTVVKIDRDEVRLVTVAAVEHRDLAPRIDAEDLGIAQRGERNRHELAGASRVEPEIGR